MDLAWCIKIDCFINCPGRRALGCGLLLGVGKHPAERLCSTVLANQEGACALAYLNFCHVSGL